MKHLILTLLVLVLLGSNVSTYTELQKHKQFKREITELTIKRDTTKSIREHFILDDSISSIIKNYINIDKKKLKRK